MATECVSVREQLEALVDGDLADLPADQVRRHLAACDDCRAHHAEACSLPARLRAGRGPEPPASLVAGVMRRVGRERLSPLQLWGPLVVEVTLFLVALWYLSGPRGLYILAQRTTADVGALLGWGIDQAALPAPPLGDVFLLVVCGLLLVTTLYHLALLSRQGLRLS